MSLFDENHFYLWVLLIVKKPRQIIQHQQKPKLYYCLPLYYIQSFLKPKKFNCVSKFIEKGLQSLSKIKSSSKDVRWYKCKWDEFRQAWKEI